MGAMVADGIDANVMRPAATAETARDRLRNATTETHRRLHSQSCFVRLMNGSQTVADYRQLIARLYGFHAPLEASLRDVPSHWCYRS